MRVLPFFKPKKGWHVAGTNLETDSGGGSYVLPTASADTLGGVKIGEGVTIDDNGVLSANGGVDPSMIAGTEPTTTSAHVYAIGDYFISSTGLLCKATNAIAIDDTISIGTSAGDNAITVTVGGELTELNSKITKHTLSNVWYDLLSLNTSESNPFVAPHDGYLMVNSGNDKGVVAIKSPYQLYIGGGASGFASSVTFIRKGMEMYVGSPAPAIAAFYILE